MATVAQVAKASFGKILVSASEAPTEPDEYEDFIFSMNNFMLDLEAKGVRLGYTEVNGLSDVVTIPSGALRGLINNMAVEIADDYGGTVTQVLASLALEGLKTMRKLGITRKATAFPATLPMGSGNDGDWYNSSKHYYSDEEQGILASVVSYLGSATAVAIAGAGTAVKIGGNWVDVISEYFTVDRLGKVTYTAANNASKVITFTLNCAPDTGTNINYTATIYVNGAAVAISAVSAQASENDTAQILLTLSRTFKKNDYVEIYLQNDDDTTDFTVNNATLNIG